MILFSHAHASSLKIMESRPCLEHLHIHKPSPILLPAVAVGSHGSPSLVLMQELQANNAALVNAVRQLGHEQDKIREEVRAEVQAEKEAHLKGLRAELDNMRQLHQKHEVLFQQLWWLHCRSLMSVFRASDFH